MSTRHRRGRTTLGLILLASAALWGCTRGSADARARKGSTTTPSSAAKKAAVSGKYAPQPTVPAGAKVAIFAGGCFWCVQPPYDKLPGVLSTTVGYAGGSEKRPTYKRVAYGLTGHTESIKIVYDPKKVSYKQLVGVLWRNIDPTDKGGQFVDRGKQYRPAIFYVDEAQKKVATASRDALQKSGRFSKPIAVEITKATAFWPAERYHQTFYKKNPGRYYSYRRGSGRDRFIARHWSAKKK